MSNRSVIPLELRDKIRAVQRENKMLALGKGNGKTKKVIVDKVRKVLQDFYGLKTTCGYSQFGLSREQTGVPIKLVSPTGRKVAVFYVVLTREGAFKRVSVSRDAGISDMDENLIALVNTEVCFAS